MAIGIKQFLLFGYHKILVTAKYWTITQFELVFKSKSVQKNSKSLNWIDENKRQALRSLHVRRRFKKSVDLGSNPVYLLMAMFHQRQFGFALVRTLLAHTRVNVMLVLYSERFNCEEYTGRKAILVIAFRASSSEHLFKRLSNKVIQLKKFQWQTKTI